MTTAVKAPAARFEISIDGVPRSHRDRREIAVEVASVGVRTATKTSVKPGAGG